jgi:hypothetical protein
MDALENLTADERLPALETLLKTLAAALGAESTE